jgi:hypothetical protein
MSSTVGCVFCQRLPESNYQQPRAVVTQVVSDDRKIVTRVQVDWGSWEPKLEALECAPGSLYVAQHPHAEVIQLHQLRSALGSLLTFRTVGSSEALPVVGEQYVYGVWWIPDATALVETPRLWRSALVIGHDHCLLCSQALDDTEAYAAGNVNDDWVCPSCYSKFIEHGPPWARRA